MQTGSGNDAANEQMDTGVLVNKKKLHKGNWL